MQGQQFGRVTVVSVQGRSAFGHVLVEYQCICGKRKMARAGDIRRGKVKSCGCLRIDSNRDQPHAKGKHWRWHKRGQAA